MTWSNPVYETLVRLVNVRTGLHFLPSRHESAELGIRRAMVQARVIDPNRYHALLLTDANAFDSLVNELTVGETYFFREPSQFAFIRSEVLPEIRRRRGHEAIIRTWSAACASGEEAYSLAILFDQEGLADRGRVLATDVSRAALARAQRAHYNNWSLRGEGAAQPQPYLMAQGARVRGESSARLVLDEKIRQRVTFDYLNLALAVYPSTTTNTGDMDLILCRNVLIYFDAETVQRVASRLFESLAPGGWLFTAAADPPLKVQPPWEVVVTQVGVFYRQSLEDVASMAGGGVAGGAWSVERAEEEIAVPDPYPRTTYHAPHTTHHVPVAPPPPLDPLTAARSALARGDFARAAALTGKLVGDAATALLHVRALANLDVSLAEQACATAAARHPLSTEIHYLHAVLWLDLGRHHEAITALRRVLYLDRSLAVAHFTLATLLKQQGDQAGARRAYRNARELCAALPAEEVLMLSEGESAARLLEAATYQLANLDAVGEKTS